MRKRWPTLRRSLELQQQTSVATATGTLVGVANTSVAVVSVQQARAATAATTTGTATAGASSARPRPQPIAGTPPPDPAEKCDHKMIQQTCTLFGLDLVRYFKVTFIRINLPLFSTVIPSSHRCKNMIFFSIDNIH